MLVTSSVGLFTRVFFILFLQTLMVFCLNTRTQFEEPRVAHQSLPSPRKQRICVRATVHACTLARLCECTDVCARACVSRAGSSQTRSASNGQWPKPRRGWCYLSRQDSHIPLFLHLPLLLCPPPSPPLTKSQLTCRAPPGASARLSSFGHLSLFVWLQGNIYTFIHPSFAFSFWFHFSPISRVFIHI